MKEKKLNLKPFNLEEAKSGKPVCTRDGRDASIILSSLKNKNFPIIAIVDCDGEENVYQYDINGVCDEHDENLDLMMVSVEHYGWINIHKDSITKARWITPIIFSTEQEAKRKDKTGCIIDTIRIQWRDD